VRVCEECTYELPSDRYVDTARSHPYHVHCDCCGRAMDKDGAPIGPAAGHDFGGCPLYRQPRPVEWDAGPNDHPRARDRLDD